MKIVVIGDSGMVGSRVAAELKSRGHDVTGVRRATGVEVTNPDSVAKAVAGADAVVSAVSARGVDYTLADQARSLTDGLRRDGVRRVVVVGGAGSLEVAPGMRLMDSPQFPDEFKPEAAQAAEALEFFRSVDDLDWTYLSPPMMLQPGERKGQYRLGGEKLLADESGNSAISAEDYAIAVADLVERGDHIRERVTVAW